MSERSHDWLAQAERDLRHAHNALDDQDYEWACFAAQQAAEEAVKAVLLRRGLEGWGHSISHLLASLPPQDTVPAGVRESALMLDRYYIINRYPNGFAQGAPGDYFLHKDAIDAIEHAYRVLEFVRGRLGL